MSIVKRTNRNQSCRRAASVLLLIAATAFASQHVYLVHGYGAMRASMRPMDRLLRQHGYTTTNWSYASLHTALPDAGRDLWLDVVAKHSSDTVSFVTHSMGGLVVRSMLSCALHDTVSPVVGRIVMLSPPNQGSWWADVFGKSRVMSWIMGPNLAHMKTDSSSLAHTLPIPPQGSLGIIAGARFDARGYNPFIKGDNDGFLTPEQTKLGAGEDFVIIPEVHFFMPQNRKSKILALYFLQNGSFPDSATTVPTPTGSDTTP